MPIHPISGMSDRLKEAALFYKHIGTVFIHLQG
jgi:hypothetical protein